MLNVQSEGHLPQNRSVRASFYRKLQNDQEKRGVLTYTSFMQDAITLIRSSSIRIITVLTYTLFMQDAITLIRSSSIRIITVITVRGSN